MKQLLSGVLLFSGVLGAAFNPSFWAYRREVKTVQAPFDVLLFDASAYQNSQAHLTDLRLLRSGSEVPYILRVLSGGLEERTFRPVLTDRVAIRGLGTQAVLNIPAAARHNRVKIETDKTNFRQQVRIETSDDRQHWGTVRADGTIFDVSTPDQHASNLSVSYPDSTQRYLRLTIEGWNNPKALRSVSMSFVRESPAEREVIVDQAAKVSTHAGTHSSILNVDLGFERAFDRIRFDIAPGFFSREISVSVGHDGKTWFAAGFGNVRRTTREEQLFVTVPEQWARHVRITVSNQDNPPLTFTRIRMEAMRRELIFPADAAGSYWLYSGNRKAEPVHYDLQTILPAQVSLVPASFGRMEKNPEYEPAKPPVTERAPWLLPTLLVILASTLGAIAFRMLRQLRTSQ